MGERKNMIDIRNTLLREQIKKAGGKVPKPAEAARATIAMIQGRVEGRAWDQETWIEHGPCGTTCCVAGDVTLQTGLPVKPNRFGGITVMGIEGNSSPFLVGRAILDLQVGEANHLFSADRTEEEVLDALQRIEQGQLVHDGGEA